MYVRIEKNTEVGQHAIKPLNLDLFLSLFDIFYFFLFCPGTRFGFILSFTVEANVSEREYISRDGHR
jgi:hypothetical protein